MKRRTFLIGSGGTALGGSALLGSGAFSQIESQRRVKIEVSKDPDAYLGLDGCPDSPNSSYTEIDKSGHLAIEMSPDNPTEGGGEGVNSDSQTRFHNVFEICNNGKQEVCVWIHDKDDWPVVPDEYKAAGDRRVDFYLENDPGQSIIGEDNSLILDVGDCLCIGIEVNTKGLKEGDQLLDEFDNIIKIIADEECPSSVDPPVEGEPRTIGFWRNWSGDCTPGGQEDILGQTLEDASGINLGDLLITRDGEGDPPVTDTCGATEILGKRDLDGTVRANDGAYALAAQLLAAKLNRERDVPTNPGGDPDTCENVEEQIDLGQALLDDINFDGTGSYLPPGTDRRGEALDIADCLDQFNNGELDFQQ